LIFQRLSLVFITGYLTCLFSHGPISGMGLMLQHQ